MIDETDDWRHDNIGRLLNNAVRRFETRVFEILREAGHGESRMSLLGLTRNLDLTGTRVTELARRAGMTKQGMSETVAQGEKLGLVTRIAEEKDRRAKTVMFTAQGRAWLAAFRTALRQAEEEMRAELGGAAVADLAASLIRYGRAFDPLSPGGVGDSTP